MTLTVAAMLHQFRQEWLAVQGRGRDGAVDRAGFPFFLTQGTICRGRALAEQRHQTAGISQIREGLAGYQATGAEVRRSQFLALLAEAYGKSRG